MKQSDKVGYFKKEINYLKELSFILEEGADEARQIKDKCEQLNLEMDSLLKEVLLSGKYDKKSAILYIQSGAGGRDAEDWVTLLLRMYQRYCEKKRWVFKLISQSFTQAGGPEGRIGIRDVSALIQGKFAYGFLKKETGVHRLVRLSPFSAKGLRHTAFAKVEVLPKVEETDYSEIKLKPDDLKIETFRSSGPGGQNVNRRETAVRITHLPTGLQSSSQVERLQGMNRKIAAQLLISKLVALKEQETERELAKIKGKRLSIEFGHQIRSYVLHPYKLVKDHRTEVETSDVEKVLQGDLDRFIEAEMTF